MLGLYLLCIMFAIVHMEHVMPINRPLTRLISFYSDYEGISNTILEAISVYTQASSSYLIWVASYI